MQKSIDQVLEIAEQFQNGVQTCRIASSKSLKVQIVAGGCRQLRETIREVLAQQLMAALESSEDGCDMALMRRRIIKG